MSKKWVSFPVVTGALKEAGILAATYTATTGTLNYVLTNECAQVPDCVTNAERLILFAIAYLGIQLGRYVIGHRRIQ